jgi:glycosyltransferase involved in cell wall biosynthesis
VVNQQPLVSVIMPFYNGHDHIVDSVKSVLTQTYRNFELIIVNDGSRAPSPKELLAKYDCSQIRFIDHERNKGLAAARNTAYEAVAGEYMVPLDCDDMIAPSFLAETVEVLLKNPDVDAVYTQVRVFGEVNLDWVPDATMINLMCGLPIPSTVLYRKPVFEKVGGYNTSIKYVPDVDFWIRALSKGVRLQRVEKPLYHYRKHTNSLSDVGQLAEIQVLAEANKELYQKNMSAVLSPGAKAFSGQIRIR